MTLSQYDYVFAIGTFFALLDAFNNGASEYLPSLPYSPRCLGNGFLSMYGMQPLTVFVSWQTMWPTLGPPVSLPDRSPIDRP
jgi:sodium-dependent phosphate transporter